MLKSSQQLRRCPLLIRLLRRIRSFRRFALVFAGRVGCLEKGLVIRRRGLDLGPGLVLGSGGVTGILSPFALFLIFWLEFEPFLGLGQILAAGLPFGFVL